MLESLGPLSDEEYAIILAHAIKTHHPGDKCPCKDCLAAE
jgi:hypothetical protein